MRTVSSLLATLLATLLAAPALAGGPTFAISGGCPGPLTFEITGVTPGATVGILAGAPGSDTLPAGPCADVRTDLSSVRLVTTMRDADRDGMLTLEPVVPEAACGRTVQVVDLASCALTNTAVLAEELPEIVLQLTPITGAPIDGDSPGWADKGYTFTADTTFDIQGGSWLIDTAADGLVRMSVYSWPELELLGRGSTAFGVGFDSWLRSDLDFRFDAGEGYLVAFYTNRADSASFIRQDSPAYGYAVGGRVSNVTGWASYNDGDDAPEGVDAGGYHGNTWAPYQILHVVD